jgi:rhodanese-related sulfurtransferase
VIGDRAAKDALFDGFAEVAKALSSGRRNELIDVLAQGERHVEDLAAEIGHSIANTSFHLRALLHAGLVSTRREGTRIFYRLASARVGDLWAALRDVAAAHHSQLDELAAGYLGDRTELEQITRRELLSRLEAGEVVVIDVRPGVEFQSGHISGARWVNPGNLDGRFTSHLIDQLADVALDMEIVAYCRGPYCRFADEAVRALRVAGRRARRLEEGYPEWARAGFPSVTTISA